MPPPRLFCRRFWRYRFYWLAARRIQCRARGLCRDLPEAIAAPRRALDFAPHAQAAAIYAALRHCSFVSMAARLSRLFGASVLLFAARTLHACLPARSFCRWLAASPRMSCDLSASYAVAIMPRRFAPRRRRCHVDCLAFRFSMASRASVASALGRSVRSAARLSPVRSRRPVRFIITFATPCAQVGTSKLRDVIQQDDLTRRPFYIFRYRLRCDGFSAGLDYRRTVTTICVELAATPRRPFAWLRQSATLEGARDSSWPHIAMGSRTAATRR